MSSRRTSTCSACGSVLSLQGGSGGQLQITSCSSMSVSELLARLRAHVSFLRSKDLIDSFFFARVLSCLAVVANVDGRLPTASSSVCSENGVSDTNAIRSQTSSEELDDDHGFAILEDPAYQARRREVKFK